MKATFTKAIRYFVDAVCESPLRTSGSVKNMQSILRNADHVPFLQGASLAGAFLNWRNDPELFGDSKGQKSALIISDFYLAQAEPVLRPRLRINGITGTAASSAKFDVAALPRGTRGSFQITWTGNEDPQAIAPRIEAYLSALNSGEIMLGALKTNGFGRVVLDVKRRIYDLTSGPDLDAWLLGDDVADAETIRLSQRMESNILFTVTGSMPDVLVKSSSGERSRGGAHSVQMRETGLALIPGSSLKGTIRNQMTRICGFFGYKDYDLERIFGHENRRNLGGKAGVIRFSDGILTDEKTIQTNRIRINRLTGGVMGTGLFTEESVSAALKFEIRIPAHHQGGCALLLYALRDLGLGLYELGSGTATGRGRIHDLQVQIQGIDSQAQLRWAGDHMELSDPDGLVAGWEQELRGGKPL